MAALYRYCYCFFVVALLVLFACCLLVLMLQRRCVALVFDVTAKLCAAFRMRYLGTQVKLIKSVTFYRMAALRSS